jgi:threonine dehydratase
VTGWLEALPAAISAARDRIAPHIHRTPVVEAPWYSGLELHLKCEHLQHTGSFKFRGALNRLLCLEEGARRRGVIAASTGNHGQGIARAARITSVPATVYAPEDAAEIKLAPMRAMGVTLRTVAGDGLAAELAARAAAAAEQRTFVSPYNDPLVIAGQGTIGLELAEAGAWDAVFVAVGGGGLISGIGAALKQLQPEARIVGCWPANAPAMARCLEAGRIMEVAERQTVSDGTAGGVEPGAITLEGCLAVLDEQVLVSEAEIGEAMARLAVEERFVVEGAAGVALAALCKRAPDYAGARVAVVLCGRNIAFPRFLEASGFNGAPAVS